MITDEQVNIISVNTAFEKITGYSKAEILGEKPSFLQSKKHPVAFYKKMWKTLKESGSWRGEIWNKKKDGAYFPEWLTISMVKNNAGQLINYIGVFSDISEIKKAQDDLEFIAYHDPLTELPNRLLFYQRLTQSIKRSERSGTSTALMFIDLDRFKHINDSLGHNVGDELLKLVARRLSRMLRGNDTVSRIGGDEFTVIIEDLKSTRKIIPVARKVISSFSGVFVAAGHDLYISPSIGISVYPDDGTAPDVLIRNADAAMYRAKEKGRNAYEFYTPGLTDLAMQRVSLESKINRAIIDQEFQLYYQPLYDTKSGELVGAEALIRWHPNQHDVIPPSRFIPIIEESPTILKLGELVFELAGRQINQWQRQGYQLVPVSINISGRQAQQKNFATHLASIMNKYSIDKSIIDLEITEGFIMQQAKAEIESLHEFRAMGISLAIDDFGTGHSSLTHLKLLPIDKLKIDRSFIRDIGKDPHGEAIVRAIIALGHSLGITIVAEGVETEAQHLFLSNENCDQLQGFLLSKPIPAEDFQLLLERDVMLD